MAIKKNIDSKQSLNNTKNDFSIADLDGLSENNITAPEKEKIQLAQALDQESLNNIQSDASIDLIPPDEINANNVGIPQEEINVESVDNITEELGSESISPELFAGDSNDGIPQQETNNESPIAEESNITGPVEEIPEGSPALGTANLDQSISDINNIEFAPEESDFLGAPNEDNDLSVTTEITADNNIEELAPEEVVLESNPSEGLSDVENVVQDNNEELTPEISETAGIPLEEVGEEQAFNQTITTDEQDIPPILSEIAGAPELELSDSNEIEVTENIIAPTESFAEGNPLLADTEESIFNQEDSIVEIAEIGPEQSEILGQPVQTLEEIDTESDIQLAEIAPEQSDPEGIPQEEDIEIADSFEVADVEQLAPQEGNVQDYIETVFEEKLSEGIKKGLSSEEAAVAAIEAGREAVKESASTPEEISEFAENFNQNIIEDINNKIEKIENDIQQIKEKSINDKITEVAEAAEETVPQEETTEIAQAAEETVPQEETAEVETEVAQTDIFSQDTNEQFEDQVLDSIISDTVVSSDESIDQIETLSSLSEDIEDVEVTETDQVSDEEIEEISDEVEEEEIETQVASVDNLLLSNTNNLNSENVEGLNLTSSLTGTSSLLINAGSSGSNILAGVSSLGSTIILSAAASIGTETLGSVEFLSGLGLENITSLDTVSLEETAIEEGEVIFNEPIVDFDGDGIGDNVDTDDDNDGTLDTDDVFPFDSSESSDFDSDGTGDNADTDDDGDGVLDVNDEFPFDADNGVIYPTTGDDVLIGGTGDTEFSYDFNSNVIGGSDTLSDQGTTSDDRIFFNNIDNNHTIFLTDTDNGNIRVETFDETSGIPNSINNITTPISDGELGIEDSYFGRGSNSDTYEGTDVFSVQDIQNIAGSGSIAYGVKVGSSGADTANVNNISLSDYDVYSSFDNNPYSGRELSGTILFTKAGSDTVYTSSEQVTYAHLGNDFDRVDMINEGASLASSGSFFDGGDDDDTITGTTSADHFGFNESDYTDAQKSANSAFLTEQGTTANISSVDDFYFRNFETIDAWEGDDTFFFGGDPGNNIYALGYFGSDTYNFNYALTSNIDASAEQGDDIFNINVSPDTGSLTLSGSSGADTYNFNTDITSNITANAGQDDDTFNFNSSITGSVSINSGLGFDEFSFSSLNSSTGLTIDDFETGSDTFEFGSSAFSGITGHVLVYGTVNGTEFMPDATSIDDAGGFAFDNTDTAQPDLLSIDNDYWYYDVNDGSLYYDQNSDQFIDDAVKIATVTNDGSTLTAQSTIKSSDITYLDETDTPTV